MPQPTEVFYHGTSLEAALAIQETGFRVDLSGTNAGAMLGSGVYITTTLEKALNYAKVKEHAGAIFKLKVDLGKCLELKPNDPHMRDWHAQGYDSAFSPAGANGQREENCVRDAARIQIDDVILGHTGDAERAGFRVRDGRLYYQLAGVPRATAQLAPPTAGVLLLEHPHAPCNGVFRQVAELEHGGYPLLINQSGMQLYRSWESGGVWCLSSAAHADGFASHSCVATDGEIPIGTTEWRVVTATAVATDGAAADGGGDDSSTHLCTTSLLHDSDPMTAVVEGCYNQAALADGHVEAVKSAVAVAAGVAVAAAAGAGAIAAAPAALAAGVMVGQGAVIGAVSGAAAARSVLYHPMLGLEARAVLSLNGTKGHHRNSNNAMLFVCSLSIKVVIWMRLRNRMTSMSMRRRVVREGSGAARDSRRRRARGGSSRRHRDGRSGLGSCCSGDRPRDGRVRSRKPLLIEFQRVGMIAA